jgi:hypothetical protein
LKDGVGLGELNTALGSDELGGHDLADRVVQVVVELNITRGDDTEKLGAKLAGLCETMLVVLSQKRAQTEKRIVCIFSDSKMFLHNRLT